MIQPVATLVRGGELLAPEFLHRIREVKIPRPRQTALKRSVLSEIDSKVRSRITIGFGSKGDHWLLRDDASGAQVETFIPNAQFLVIVFFGDVDPDLQEETKAIEKQPAKRGRPKGSKNKKTSKELKFEKQEEPDTVSASSSDEGDSFEEGGIPDGERKRKKPQAVSKAKSQPKAKAVVRTVKEASVAKTPKTPNLANKRKSVVDLDVETIKKRKVEVASSQSKKRKAANMRSAAKRQKVGLALSSSENLSSEPPASVSETGMLVRHENPELDYENSLIAWESDNAPKEGVLIRTGPDANGDEEYSLALLDAGVSVDEYSYFCGESPEIALGSEDFCAYLTSSEMKKKREIPR